MTNMQLYLAIGIPSLLILSNTGAMFFLFSQVNVRFDKQDARMDRIDVRMDRLDVRMGQIGICLDRIKADLRQFFSITGAHTEAIDTLKKRL